MASLGTADFRFAPVEPTAADDLRKRLAAAWFHTRPWRAAGAESYRRAI